MLFENIKLGNNIKKKQPPEVKNLQILKSYHTK